MLSSVFHAVVSWLLGLSLANAVILAAVAYYVVKNGGPTVVSKVGGFLSPVSTRVSSLESDVALIKAQMAGTAGAYTAPAAAPAAAKPAAPAAAPAPAAHPAAHVAPATPAAAPAASEPAKA
jgi:hypothetical protein